MNLPTPQPATPPTPAPRPAQLAWITPEPLNVAPHLVGLPLAAPVRRAWAMGVDLLVVALLSGVSGLWLLAGLALVVLQLRSPKGSTTRKNAVVGWLGAGLLLLLALQAAQSAWQDRDGSPAAVTAAPVASPAPEVPVASAASAAESAASAAEMRISQLQAELAAAQRPLSWRQQLDRVLDSVGASLGWGIVYFSLLPAWWGGQTVGKKLLGLQVVELTGKPMTVMRCLKRYGGYAAGMATGGLGFVQALWDPNRQALQDKAAHTAVVDLRAAAAGAQQGMDTPPPQA